MGYSNTLGNDKKGSLISSRYQGVITEGSRCSMRASKNYSTAGVHIVLFRFFHLYSSCCVLFSLIRVSMFSFTSVHLSLFSTQGFWSLLFTFSRVCCLFSVLSSRHGFYFFCYFCSPSGIFLRFLSSVFYNIIKT